MVAFDPVSVKMCIQCEVRVKISIRCSCSANEGLFNLVFVSFFEKPLFLTSFHIRYLVKRDTSEMVVNLKKRSVRVITLIIIHQK